MQGLSGYAVPVYLLDTVLTGNSQFDQTLTDQLYGGDEYYRLCQEVVLGIGGMEILNALGYKHVATYHMNEGHASLLTLALLETHLAGRSLKDVTAEDLDFLRRRCVFTTHTPVPAGHDQFPKDLVRRVVGDESVALLEKLGRFTESALNMTFLGCAVRTISTELPCNTAKSREGCFRTTRFAPSKRRARHNVDLSSVSGALRQARS